MPASARGETARGVRENAPNAFGRTAPITASGWTAKRRNRCSPCDPRTTAIDDRRRRNVGRVDGAAVLSCMMKPTPSEPDVEHLLQAAANDPVQRPAFNDALLSGDVYVLGVVEGDVVGGVAGVGTSLRLATTADGDGPLTPFFTSEAALQRYLGARPGSDPRFVRLGCRPFLEMTKGSRLALNLGSDYGKHFVPAEVEALLAGREPGVTTEVLQAERQVFVGAAAHVPPDLPKVLTRFLETRPVEAAHLGWIAHPDGHTGYLMLVVAADSEAAMSGFGALAIGDVTGGETLDVMVLTPGSDSPFLQSVPRFFRGLSQAKRRWGFGRE